MLYRTLTIFFALILPWTLFRENAVTHPRVDAHPRSDATTQTQAQTADDQGERPPTDISPDTDMPPGIDVPIQTVNLDQLRQRTMQSGSDTLFVLNFWATWCRPCVKELPYFEKAGTDFANRPVRIILVSLDMKSEKDRVASFVSSNKIRNEVMMLDAGNPDIWINAIDRTWTGSIPATVFYRAGEKKLFHEGQLDRKELYGLITKHLN